MKKSVITFYVITMIVYEVTPIFFEMNANVFGVFGGVKYIVFLFRVPRL